jgi:outer membrane protein assembly factor BamA
VFIFAEISLPGLKMRRKKLFKILIGLFVAAFFYSCSSTKFVPEGQYLLNDTDIEIDNKTINREELKAQVRQKENLKILGFIKFHLGLYNLSSKKNEDGWFKRIGEEPVIYDEFLTVRSKDQLRLYLKNKGYYHAKISEELVLKEKKQKLDVVYSIETGEPTLVRNYAYQFADSQIKPAVFADTANQLINQGDIFDVDVLNEERKRISDRLKDQGYYDFSSEYISYLADTSLSGKQVDLIVSISDNDPGDQIDPIRPFKKFIVRNYKITPDFIPVQLRGGQEFSAPDTLYDPPYTIFYRDKLKYKPELFYNINRIPDSTYYSLKNVEKTYRSLVQLRQFRIVNLNFNEVPQLANDSIGVLDCNFQLSALPRQGFSADLEGTNSSGNLGVAGSLNYLHRNIFRGAEIFNLNLKGAIERQQTLIENNLDFNTREFGLEGSLSIPKFLNPIKGKRLFNYQVPQTDFTLGYNFQRRPDYTRTITNFKFGYNWKTSTTKTHFLSLVDLNYVNLSEFNEVFLNSIRDLYIKSSFTDHLILAMNYTQVDNTQNLKRREDYRYFKWSFESAGNVLAAFSALTNQEQQSQVDSITGQVSNFHEVLGTRYAQYLKADFEYRYGHMIDKFNSIVARAFVGIGLPYGNFDVLPFEKKYFTGGANGIRAWQVRSLGPGTYEAPEGTYPNQSSDIKLEANVEYRYRFVWRIEGAFFLDAGNIWAINEKDNRTNAQFHFDQFYKQIAVGTGMGLRFDFTYFIFRLDLGMKLRDPSLDEGKRFIIGNYPISAKHFNLSFAIGYPF